MSQSMTHSSSRLCDTATTVDCSVFFSCEMTSGWPRADSCGSSSDNHSEALYQIAFFNSYLLVTFQAGTLVTPAIILSVLSEEFRLPRAKVECDIWDIRGCEADRDIDVDAMFQIVSFIKERFHSKLLHRKTAIVVDQDVTYGLTRMFQILADDLPYEIEIFRTYREAQQWIENEGT